MGRFTLGSHWQDATIGSAAVRLRQHIGIVPEILPRRIMIPAGVFVVAFAHRVRKPDDAFFIDIADEAAAFTAVGATDLAPVTVFLEMKPVLTHGRADFRRLHTALLHFDTRPRPFRRPKVQ